MSKFKKMLKQKLSNPLSVQSLLFAIAFAGIGLYFLNVSHALTFGTSGEAESGSISGNASILSDSNASGGNAVKFGSNTGFVTRNNQQLMLNGQPFKMVGFNIWRANVAFKLPNTGYILNTNNPATDPTTTVLSQSMDAIHANCPNCNTIRAWFYQQEVTPTTSGYNWTPFDNTLSLAQQKGFKVIATLADEWDFETANTGAPELLLPWYQGGYKTDTHKGTSGGASYNENVPYRQYVQDVVSRYKNNPAIAAWELVNEGEAVSDASESCPSEATAETAMRSFVDDVGGLIHATDPNHLVSSGFAGNGNCGTNDTDYQPVMASPGIDICSFHDYEGATNAGATNNPNGLDHRVAQCGSLSKPIVVGEAGIRLTDSAVNNNLNTRATLLDNKATAQFAYQGVVGFIPWDWDSRRYTGVGGTSGDYYTYGDGDPALAVLNKYAQ